MQHELMPRVALDVGYFRRSWAHFQVTDNVLVGPEDFTRSTWWHPPTRGFQTVAATR